MENKQSLEVVLVSLLVRIKELGISPKQFLDEMDTNEEYSELVNSYVTEDMNQEDIEEYRGVVKQSLEISDSVLKSFNL